MQMLLSSLTLSLASLALAAPTPQFTDSSPATVPERSQEFGVAFSVRSSGSKVYYGVTVESDPSYSSTDLLLVGTDLTQLPAHAATPAYVVRNGTFYNDALIFDLRNQTNDPAGLYGAFALELGEAYGNEAAVSAVKGRSEFKWSVNGTIDHERDAAPQQFFACNRTVNGAPATVLAFGVTNENLGSPENCEFTDVIQTYNIPGGLLNPAGP